VNVWAGAAQRGFHSIPKGQALLTSYAGVNKGPVKIMCTSFDPILGSEAVTYSLNGTVLSFSEMMALPANQVSKVYWLPWYDNQDSSTQLRVANVSDTQATVHVRIGGVEVTGSPFTLAPGASLRKSLIGSDKGPVKIVSDANIVAAERVIYKTNGVTTSYSEMLALPASQLDKVYWLPWYNSKTMDTQLRMVNVSASNATVHVTIGDGEVVGSPFTLAPGQSLHKTFPNIDKGPVKFESNVNIVAAERVIYKVNGVDTSFSEMMALPAKQLHTIYWLPWYNRVDMDTQLRIANVSDTETTVRVFIGGLEMTGSPFTLAPGVSARRTFAGIKAGPVKIVSTQNIVASERVIYKVNGVDTSFSEMMALPGNQLNTIYWLPWYNNVDMDTELRLGAP
jgi:hypothetical protein